MKVKFPSDLQGRMILCEERAKMIGSALQAIAHSDLVSPDRETLNAFGAVALELSEEIRAIEEAYIEEANNAYVSGGAR